MKKRAAALSLVIALFVTGICGRIGQIAFGNSYSASSGYNSYSILIDKKYTNIYYRDMSYATNNISRYVAVVRPNSRAIAEAREILSDEKYKYVLELASSGKPVAVELTSRPDRELKDISLFLGYGSENNCYQLFSPASGGLLRYASEEIGRKSLSFSVDARGRLLEGDYGKYKESNYASLRGYRTSIDERIQNVALQATENMREGAVVVLSVSDGSILACVNRPLESYNIKALMNYSVGSAFKLVIAACALENNINPEYKCSGKIRVGDTIFSCQRGHKHGLQNIRSALANSCNCYFVNLALTLGSEKIISTATALGYLDSIELFEDWSIKPAVLPTKEELQSKGQLALLGFGQGRLLVSPLQLASTLCTIARGGEHLPPSLILSEIADNGASRQYSEAVPSKALSESTCKSLLDAMRYVVANGTGRNADDSKSESAGKTATAQTGQFADGREKVNTWFAGVYPYSSPKYAIVVMTENGKSGAEDCCPVFRTIVENL